MQSILDNIKNLSIRDPRFRDIVRHDRVENGFLHTEILIRLSSPLKRSRSCVAKKISIDDALPARRKEDPEWMEDVSTPTAEWISMTEQERLNYLDREMDEYWDQYAEKLFGQEERLNLDREMDKYWVQYAKKKLGSQ